LQTAVRTKARYIDDNGNVAPGNPAATYDWYIFKKTIRLPMQVLASAGKPHNGKKTIFWNGSQFKFFAIFVEMMCIIKRRLQQAKGK